MVTNPNIGLRPARQRGAARPEPALPRLRLPARAVLRAQGSRHRRRAHLRLAPAQHLRVPLRARFSDFGRVYLLVGAVLGGVLLYLGQAAGATQASYEIGRLQGQQQELVAEQDHLRYQEAAIKSPSRIEAEAAQANLARPQPYKYVQFQDSGIVLDRPAPSPPDVTPLWERALASVARRVTGTQDAMAAGR
ncbi:MAG: hypothetical protein M3Z13_07755 [Candidatus Dormibacteraeota bacterium]|nr:hypothetical protein [Candidatus Dormibacteraeota bacterium]